MKRQGTGVYARMVEELIATQVVMTALVVTLNEVSNKLSAHAMIDLDTIADKLIEQLKKPIPLFVTCEECGRGYCPGDVVPEATTENAPWEELKKAG
jgi:hypothetical protein